MCVSLHSSYPFSCTHTLSSNHWLALLSPRPLLLWRLRKSSRCLGGWEIQHLLLVLSVLSHIFMFPLHSQPLKFLLLFTVILFLLFYPAHLIFLFYYVIFIISFVIHSSLFFSISWFSFQSLFASFFPFIFLCTLNLFFLLHSVQSSTCKWFSFFISLFYSS